MARSRLQRCTKCGAYGLKMKCKQCGAPAKSAAPLRFSPEDPQADRRRKFLNVGSEEWLATIPVPSGKKTDSGDCEE